MLTIHGLNERKAHDFQVARVPAYSVHIHNTDTKHRMSIYDFWPLPGDPTQEEREAAEKREAQKRAEWAVNLFNQYKAEGHI